MPTARGWGLLLLAVVLVGAWSLLGLREVRDLAVLLAALVVVGGLLLALEVAWARPRFDVRVTAATPAPGERTRVLVSLSHRLPFPLPVTLEWAPDPGGRLSLVGHSSDEGAGRTPARSPLDVPAGPGTRRGIDLVARTRGASGVDLRALVVFDSLGLTRCRLPLGVHADVVVLPALLPPDRVEDLAVDLGGASAVAGTGEPGGNLRDHRDGDPLRLIHWKQTARQGRLLVNVPESPAGAHHRIHLVTDPEAHTRDGFEEAVSLVATLVVRDLARGDEVDLGSGPRGGEPRPVRSEALALRRLALVEEEPGEGAADGSAEAPPAPCLHGLVVTGRATPTLLEDMRDGGGGIVALTDADPVGVRDLPAPGAWRWLVVGGGEP